MSWHLAENSHNKCDYQEDGKVFIEKRACSRESFQEGERMRYVKGLFMGSRYQLIRALTPVEERTVVDDKDKALLVRLYRHNNSYTVTAIARFVVHDSEVELQYDAGIERPGTDALAESVKHIGNHEGEAEYIFKLAERYASGVT